MIRTNVIKVLAIYNMSVRELKLRVARKEYNKMVLRDAHMLQCQLESDVYLGKIRVFRNTSGYLWNGKGYEKVEGHPIHKLNLKLATW